MLTAGACVRVRACIRKANHFKYKVSSYIAQYPVLKIAQNALHITSLTDLFNQTPSQFIWEAPSHATINARMLLTYPPLSTARHLFMQLSELEKYRVNSFAHGFNTAGQDSNPSSRSR